MSEKTANKAERIDMNIIVYIAALVVANLLVAYIGPAAAPFIAFALIGLDLSLRDRIHERHGMALSLLAVLAAGALSYVLNPAAGMIAIASMIAFLASGLADAVAYHALLSRRPLVKMNGSNVAGALVDSIIFPLLAFPALTAAEFATIVGAQFIAKVAGGAIWAALLARREAAA